jgi:hypothetical protein
MFHGCFGVVDHAANHTRAHRIGIINPTESGCGGQTCDERPSGKSLFTIQNKPKKELREKTNAE